MSGKGVHEAEGFSCAFTDGKAPALQRSLKPDVDISAPKIQSSRNGGDISDGFMREEDFEYDAFSEIVGGGQTDDGEEEEGNVETVVAIETEDENERACERDVAGGTGAEQQAEQASENIVFHLAERKEVGAIGAKGEAGCDGGADGIGVRMQSA